MELPSAGASRREKSRHDRGPAHRSQLAKLPALSFAVRPESAFSQVRQPKAVIKRPIQHRAALLLDTLTSLLHFTALRVVDTNQIDPFALIGRRMDALKEFFANTRIVLRQLQN